MKPLSPDTAPAIERILIEGYRRMPVGEKLRRVFEMTEFLRGLALTDIRRRHPHADDRELRLRLASRMLGPRLMREAFGWDPEQEGY